MADVRRQLTASGIGVALTAAGLVLLSTPTVETARAAERDHEDHGGHAVTAEIPSPEPHYELSTTTISSTSSSDDPFARSDSSIGPSLYRQVQLVELPGSTRLLSCAGSGGLRENSLADKFTCEVYDWTTGAKTQIRLPSDWFCGAGVYDQLGNLVFAGGTGADGYPTDDGVTPSWLGSANSYQLDSQTLAITRLADMNERRWYNNLLRNWFGDNSIYTWGGINDGVYSSTWERKRSGSRVWAPLPWRHQNYSYDDYKVIDSSHVAFTGASASVEGQLPHLLNLTSGRTTTTPGLRHSDNRNAAAGIMLYPAQKKRVAVFGGGGSETLPGAEAINAADLIDYSVWPRRVPHFRPLPDMPASVMFVLATNLPNGQVLVTGGTREWRAGSVRWAAIYTPTADRWTLISPAKVPRNYHSNIVTRTDGRVQTFGGNPSYYEFESRSEIFTPWYMWRPRPTILHAPKRMRSSRSYVVDVRFPRGTKPSHVTLDSPRATTHSASDTNYGLFSATSKVIGRQGRTFRIRVRIPTAASVPLGYYKMSFVTGGEVTPRGASGMVPSRSRWVRIS